MKVLGFFYFQMRIGGTASVRNEANWIGRVIKYHLDV